MSAGEIIYGKGDLEINAGRRTVKLHVKNVGDRAVQIGSHYHFFEANKALDFDRNAAFGMRLDIAAGTAIRFEPGTEADVTLVDFGGSRRVYGFAGLVGGSLDSAQTAKDAKFRAKDRGFNGAQG